MGFKSMGVGRTCYDVGSETDASPRTILGMHYFRGLRRINVKAIGCMVGVLGFLAGTPSLGGAQQAQRASQAAQSDQVEEIYIARSVRESRVIPTEFCVQATTGFKSAIEDQYTFQSIAVGTDDGRITNENVKTIGSGHARYGYGIGVDRLDGHTILRHTGGMASFMSSLTVDLDSGVAAFASINAMLGYRLEHNPATAKQHRERILLVPVRNFDRSRHPMRFEIRAQRG